MDQSIWDLMSHGYGAMWVVVGFSVVALAVGIERAIAQWKFVTHARSLSRTVTRCLSRGALEEGRSACERSPSPIADVFLVGYERLKTTKAEHVVTAVHRERLRVNQELRTRLWMLGTIGATAPFVGLFGTVAGIIEGLGGFQKGQQVSFSDVAGPVSGALIVTAAGILVAVESVVLFNFFSQRASRIATEMKLLTDEFLELLLDAPQDSQPSRAKKLTDDEDSDADSDTEGKAKRKGGKDGDREAA
jgi:biopolymer transport protein ExbB/TolQ